IYNCETPIISAVGHETDFTICDFVADLRAPTPSGAAELAVPDQQALTELIYQHKKRLFTALDRKLKTAKERLDRYANARVLTDPHAFTDKPYMLLDHLNEKLIKAINVHCSNQKGRLEQHIAKLDALSPLKVMRRGFLAARDECGNLIHSVDQLKKDDSLLLRVTDGKVKCCVEEIEKDGALS
ncbi:MAG: exodeoxyribonuclease VII large subunit, partial [Clostridia bacterium]|nr:exodeoxyribonuclease VII large subunit [Clostridia bacterium]